MNVERDKFLIVVMGDCWHEFNGETSEGSCEWRCLNCGNVYNMFQKRSTNFSTWAGFGKLWEWAQTQEWWRDFTFGYVGYNLVMGDHQVRSLTSAIHPSRFADAVFSFLRNR